MRLYHNSIKLRIPTSVIASTLLAVAYLALRWKFLDYVPIWDGMWNYLDLLHAMSQPFNILNYCNDNHVSQGWFLVLAIANYFFPYNIFAYNLWVALLSTTSVVAFYFIIRHLLAGRLSEPEFFLAGAIMAFHPSLLSNLIQPMHDSGILIFSSWYLLALLNKRTILASITGCLLVLTKETSIPMVFVLFAFTFLWQPLEEKEAWLRQHFKALLIPYTLLIGFLIMKGWYYDQPLFWPALTRERSKVFILPNQNLKIYLLMGFVLNFNWIFTSLTALLSYAIWKLPKLHWPGLQRQFVAMLFLLACTAALVFTLRHFSNLRYLISLLMAIPIAFFFVLAALPSRATKISILAGLLLLLSWQDFRSIDPISNRIFCFTRLGTHRILHIPTNDLYLAHKNIGLPRDEFVYNTEFTVIPRLLTKIVRDTKHNKNNIFVVDSQFNWYTFPGYTMPHLTPSFSKRAHHLHVQNLDWGFVNQHRRHGIYVISFPTTMNNKYLYALKSKYRTVTYKDYDIDGYRLTVYHFTQRAPVKRYLTVENFMKICFECNN